MKIEKCPFCDKAVAEITNCKDLEECRHFEKCPATEPYVCVVCNMFEGGCGASSGYYDSVEKAITAWNRRADAAPVVRGEWVGVTHGRGGHECSKCRGYAPSFQNGVEYLSNYCPNCGADMRGKEKAE
jgi:hypothetical protein